MPFLDKDVPVIGFTGTAAQEISLLDELMLRMPRQPRQEGLPAVRRPDPKRTGGALPGTASE